MQMFVVSLWLQSSHTKGKLQNTAGLLPITGGTNALTVAVAHSATVVTIWLTTVALSQTPRGIWLGGGFTFTVRNIPMSIAPTATIAFGAVHAFGAMTVGRFAPRVTALTAEIAKIAANAITAMGAAQTFRIATLPHVQNAKLAQGAVNALGVGIAATETNRFARRTVVRIVVPANAVPMRMA